MAAKDLTKFERTIVRMVTQKGISVRKTAKILRVSSELVDKTYKRAGDKLETRYAF